MDCLAPGEITYGFCFCTQYFKFHRYWPGKICSTVPNFLKLRMILNRNFFCPLLCLFMPLFDPKHSYGNFSPSILFNTCTDVKEIKTFSWQRFELAGIKLRSFGTPAKHSISWATATKESCIKFKNFKNHPADLAPVLALVCWVQGSSLGTLIDMLGCCLFTMSSGFQPGPFERCERHFIPTYGHFFYDLASSTLTFFSQGFDKYLDPRMDQLIVNKKFIFQIEICVLF